MLMMEWKFWMVRFISWEETMSSAKNIAERYDPLNDTWETLSPMSVARLE
jgi:hypothetical protein